MEYLYRFAQSKIGNRLIGLVFSHGTGLLPVKRLLETEHTIAFHHPKPSYPLHILLVPKTAVRGLDDMTEAHEEFVLDLFHSAQTLIGQFSLNDRGYRLILNGGNYQKVPQMHLHLISESERKPTGNQWEIEGLQGG